MKFNFRWYVQRELELFRLKLMDSTAADIKTFLSFHNLNYIPITNDEKNDIRDKLNDSTMGQDATKIDLLDFYRVPFTEVPDLIRSRRCFVSKGYAYVSAFDFISVLALKHQKIIEDGLQMAKMIRVQLLEDDRFQDILKYFHTSYTGKDYSVAKDAAIPIESLDKLSKKSFPLCMRYIHEILRAKHHLKYGGRMQYGLYLKGIGVTFEDSMLFWRQEFTKNIDLEKFEKAYAYNIKHNYGKAGSMKDYSPFSCQKIINTTVGQHDTCGCPYKTFDTPTLKNRLTGYGISAGHVQDIVNYSSKGHFQLACGKYFEIFHETTLETGINHPNHFFELSQELIGKKPKAVSAVKKNHAMKRPLNTSSTQQSTQSTSQIIQESMEDLLNTPMEYDDLEISVLEKSYC